MYDCCWQERVHHPNVTNKTETHTTRASTNLQWVFLNVSSTRLKTTLNLILHLISLFVFNVPLRQKYGTLCFHTTANQVNSLLATEAEACVSYYVDCCCWTESLSPALFVLNVHEAAFLKMQHVGKVR